MAPVAAAALSLPRLCGEVPRVLYPAAQGRERARLALFLLDAGAIREADLRGPWRGEVEIMEAALNRWLARHLSGLKLIAPRFVLCPGNLDGNACDDGPRRDNVSVFWHCARIVPVSVGERLEYLEEMVPGLGRSALRALRCSGETFRIFTPDETLEAASYLYWGCAEDEADYLAEFHDDEQAREAARADMVTRQKIEAAMPAWVFERRQPLSARRLRGIARTTNDAFIAAVSRAILALRRIEVPRFPFEPDGEFVDFAALATWREDDIVLRVFDDLLNLAAEAECCDISGHVSFELSQPRAFREWMKRMGAFLNATAAADRLLWLLSRADYGQGDRS